MNLLQRLAQPVGRVAKGIGQGISNAAENHILHEPVVKAWQSINPDSGYNRAKPIVRATEKQYGFTPEFSNIVNGGNPSIAPRFQGREASGLTNGARAAAIYDAGSRVNDIQLDEDFGTNPSTLVHEGLHRAWNTKPQYKQQFPDVYRKGATPELLGYLADRMKNYTEFQGKGTEALMDFNKINPSTQTEMHSYIPEYYENTPGSKMSPEMAQYYSQFFNTNARPKGPINVDMAPRISRRSQGRALKGMVRAGRFNQ